MGTVDRVDVMDTFFSNLVKISAVSGRKLNR